MQKDFLKSYIFDYRNQELYHQMQQWLEDGLKGIYVLTGKSGCGKTEFLKAFDRKLQEVYHTNMVTWYSCAEIISYIRKEISMDGPLCLEVQTPVIIIENIEELEGRTSTQIELENMICEERLKDRLIICVSNSLELDFPESWKTILVHGIDVSPELVIKLADGMGVNVDFNRAGELSEMCNNRIGALKGLIQREKILKREALKL